MHKGCSKKSFVRRAQAIPRIKVLVRTGRKVNRFSDIKILSMLVS